MNEIPGWNEMTSEQKIAAWKERRKARVADAAKRRKVKFVLAGVDVVRALWTFRKLPVFEGNLGHVKIDVGHRVQGGCGGRAWNYARRIRIYGGPDTTKARVLEVLIHEMCHLALPAGIAHSERFRRTFARACEQAWGLDVPLDPPVEPSDRNVIAYAQSRLVVAMLEPKIEAGEVETFPAAPAPAPKPRVEQTAELVEKRAKHAVTMLARAEKKAKTAQRVLSKWRKKVAYYERAAAKRGA
jgi:hypothetical protein